MSNHDKITLGIFNQLQFATWNPVKSNIMLKIHNETLFYTKTAFGFSNPSYIISKGNLAAIITAIAQLYSQF